MRIKRLEDKFTFCKNLKPVHVFLRILVRGKKKFP